LPEFKSGDKSKPDEYFLYFQYLELFTQRRNRVRGAFSGKKTQRFPFHRTLIFFVAAWVRKGLGSVSMAPVVRNKQILMELAGMKWGKK
jgi:hypothetical protein